MKYYCPECAKNPQVTTRIGYTKPDGTMTYIDEDPPHAPQTMNVVGILEGGYGTMVGKFILQCPVCGEISDSHEITVASK